MQLHPKQSSILQINKVNNLKPKIIKLMSNFPLLKYRQYSRFSHPLAGFLYNNKKYQQSCFFEPQTNQPTEEEEQPHYPKSKSTPYSLIKINYAALQNKDYNPESLAKTSKIFNISKRLSSPINKKCSRNRWVSVQETAASRQSINIKNLFNVSKMESEFGNSRIKYSNKAKFEQISVFILDTLSNRKDQMKSVKLSLKRYFEGFFKDSLMGPVSQELADIVEKYIEQALTGEKEQINKEQNNIQLPFFTTKKGLYEKIAEYQRLDKKEEIYQLIRTYCLPKHELRDIFLNDVLNLLALQFYEEFGLNKDHKYVLLTPSGQIINDFASIPFSTKKLFAAQKSKATELYQQYIDFVKYKRMYNNKTAFRQTLKQNFREQLTQGQYEDSPSSPRSNKETAEEKKNNISRAQKILNFKNDKSSCGRVRLIKFLQQQHRQKRIKEGSPDIEKPIKMEQKSKNVVSTEQKILQEFKKLKRVSDYGDSIFKNDESCKNRILLEALQKESVYYKTKSKQQIQKIFRALEFIKEDVNLPENIKKSISLEEYVTMRRIINCTGDKHAIIHFVDRYLEYDQYGQLHKDNLRQTLAFIIGGQKKASEIILQTIWIWLQKNGVIVNEIIRRNHMQLLYERNKIVYYFLISLIFGTNDTTALELAQQILL